MGRSPIGTAIASVCLVLAAGLAAGVAVYGYWSPAPRHSVPPALVETAQVPGYQAVRFWGDVASPAFIASVEAKDHQLFDAARSGAFPGAMTKADFLAVSGGGDQGAFSAGLLAGWTRSGTRPEFEAVTGVSAGALAAPFAFLGPTHDGELRAIFTNFGSGNLYRSRGPFGLISDASNDTAPLANLIRGYATEAFLDKIAEEFRHGRRIYILTTNLDAQRPVIWDLSAIAASDRPNRRDLFVKVLLASAALPGVFPPVRIEVVADDGHTYEELHVDGGVTAELLYAPPDIQLMRIEDKIFPRRRDRVLYVVRNGKLFPEFKTSDDHALALVSRSVETLVKYQVISDLMRLQKITAANNTKFKFLSIPASFSRSPESKFSQAYSKALYQVGVEVGSTGGWNDAPPGSPELILPDNGDASPSKSKPAADGR